MQSDYGNPFGEGRLEAGLESQGNPELYIMSRRVEVIRKAVDCIAEAAQISLPPEEDYYAEKIA